jgi:NAD(P)H-hydrate epimerase
MELIRILKGSRVAEIDEKCISDGIDPKWLMGNAGSGIAKIIISDFQAKNLKRSARGVIVCGSGNNGGDGFVAAKDLVDFGMDISVFYIHPAEKFSKDSKYYFEKLKEIKGIKLDYLDVSNNESIKNFKDKTKESNFIIDAIFGTGLHGKDVYSPAKEVIEMINLMRAENSEIIVYSIDIPSGVDSDSAEVLGVAIKADKTITFGCKKIGIANYPGADFAGEVRVADIGIPDKYYGEYEQIFEASLQWVAAKLPNRKAWTYKHEVGRLLVIAGSLGFTGAAVMTCQAAMRAGAGIVTLVCPWELNTIYETKLTEVMTYPVEQTEDLSIHMDALDDILQLSEKFDALAIGPGLSKNPSIICMVREILMKIKKPTVLDADGLRALYGPRDVDEDNNLDLSHVVITPHPGELAAILGESKIALSNRLSSNLEVVKKYGLISVLKGAATLISDSGEKTFINPTGSWALATAGTGDILAGIIGSLLSQGMSLMDSAICGVYIHGMSSDIVACETSKTSQIATDLLDGIKRTFIEIEKLKYK